MPIDFTQIKTGEDFEFLCEDLLQAIGFTIEAKPTRGADFGIDLVVSQTVADVMGFTEQRKTVVQCIHRAHSGKSVRFTEVSNYREAMDQAKVRRYLLITSTIPSYELRDKFEAVTERGDYVSLIWSANDLARLLDAHPDVRQRHFPTPGPTPADELADTIEALLKVMGFICHERQPAGDHVRLICTSKGVLSRPAAVVCKEGSVSRENVEALLANVNAQGLGGGFITTHNIITPAARARATETDGLIQAFTLDAFYRELIDFEPYVRQLVTGYEQDDLSSYYVDLGCRTADGSKIKPMDGYVDAWLDDPTRNHISILGDYGTGKTSFCRQYAAKLGQRWLADPDRNRIPILISLRDYAKTMGVQQLITDFLVNRYGIQAPYEAFTRFNADGKLVLLFDGFGEMAQKVDFETTMENFEELARAVEDRGKVILTCRTPYFRTQEEAKGLLWSVSPQAHETSDLPDRPLIDLTDRPNFEIVHLLPFDDDDIRAILQKRFPGDWEAYWDQIQEIYNLAELAQRPVLLDMIAWSLPELEPGQALNAAKLYEAYTDLWLKRDEEKGRHLITRDDKRLFMQALALEMLRREELSIHYSKLPERVRDHFQLDKVHELDCFEHDIRACSFLNRDSDGNYRFAHKSFQEFFVAQWLAPKLLDGTAPEIRINKEILEFVRGILGDPDWPPPPPEGVQVPEEMAWVPPGPFIYGEAQDVQVVRLEKGFFITRTPVTNAHYARFVADTGYRPPPHWDGMSPPTELTALPVVNLTWHDAAAYAGWAGGRLPTEQQWEKAARGIDGRLYPWGGESDTTQSNVLEGGIGTVTPVGQHSRDLHPELAKGDESPCGCTGMVGNVWQWTASLWEAETDLRVARGGPFEHDGQSARTTARLKNAADQSMASLGFRYIITFPPDFAHKPLPTPEPPDLLVQACVGNHCALYAGAGLSAQAGFPTWRPFIRGLLIWAIKNGFIEHSLGESLHMTLTQGESDTVVDTIVSGVPDSDQKKPLHNYLREVFLDVSLQLPRSHQAIRDLPFSATLTTNFDNLLERAHEHLRPPVYTPKDTQPLLEALARDDFFVLKLYGALERPETVLIGPAQYEDAIADNTAFSQLMETLFFSKTILFVGASLDGIEAYVEEFSFQRYTSRQHYALVAVTDNAWRPRAKLLSKRYGIQVLPYTPSYDHHQTVEFLEKLAQEVRAATEGTSQERTLKPSWLRRVLLQNIGPYDHLELELDPHWNILLGDNGVGKSTVLKAIALAMSGKDAQPYANRLIKAGQNTGKIVLETTSRQYMTELRRTDRTVEVKSTPPIRPLDAEGWLALGFPPLRTVSWERPRGPQVEEATRRPTPDDLLPLVKGDPDPRLDELKQWIINLDYRIKDQSTKQGDDKRYTRLLQEFFRLVDRLTEDMTIRFKEVDLDTKQITVITDDGEVPIEAVSQGTASLMSWAGLLLQRLYEVHGRKDNPREQYALVLLDEIDAHMHPEWQQSLVSNLVDLFPNVQFIATTHSPLIVGGMPTQQVFRLARDEDGKVTQLEIEPDMTMGRADQVLTGTLFDLQTTLDKTTQKYIEEYQELLGKRSRTPQEETEFRQLQRLLEFRIPVPWETPPERRAQELLDALLAEQVGHDYPEVQSQVLEKAKRLLAELQTEEETKA